MSLNKPILDDRSYEQIRDELIRRIPVYAPEWTDHNVSDPGIALIELFSYLTENILFRFNQIPDATKMEFLRLLQIPLRRAQPATALVQFTTKQAEGVRVAKQSVTKAGDVQFSTQNEVRVLPVTAVAAAKVGDEPPEEGSEEEIFYRQAYRALDLESESDTAPYQVELVWEDDPGVPRDFDKSVDGILWVAVLAEKADTKAQVHSELARHEDAPLLLNIGFVPEIKLDPPEDTSTEAFADLFRCPGEGAGGDSESVNWQVSTGVVGADYAPEYRPLQVVGDTTAGLTREGVVRVQLPTDLNDAQPFVIDNPDVAGTGDLPPQLEDELEERVLFWLRAFRKDGKKFGKVLYVGANAVQVEQTLQAKAEFLGTGTGQPNQVYGLNNRQIIPESVILEVEEAQGWLPWTEVENFFASSESDRHFVVDNEAGQIQFGTGLNGFAPQIGQRIRVLGYRYGGGRAGNVAADAIGKVTPNLPVKLSNPLPAHGGADAETLAAALDRIPGELRRRERAVTRGDFRELALQTPGATIGRAEVLPRYHPQFPERESAGVVGVIVWPEEDRAHPNAPLPNKNQLRAVCRYLDARRLVTTELYVMPPKYVPVAIAVGVKVKEGFGIDAVRHWVELVLRQFLAPLPPYGPTGEGWPLGRRVYGPELEAIVHQVEGVEYVEEDANGEGLQLVGWDEAGNQIDKIVYLAKNEVPELVGITVESGPVTVDPGELLQPAPPTDTPVPIPVIKEVC